MPSAAASRKVTEQRWPVTLRPRLWASTIAAPSTTRETNMYALNEVAPLSAHSATSFRPSSAVASSGIWGASMPAPLMYGPVTSILGPGCFPASMYFLMLRSAIGCMEPPVRMVVTPAPR